MASVEQVTSRDNLIEFQQHARTLQSRCDDSLEPWSIRAPSLVAGESLDDYRRRLLILAKRQLPADHQLRKVQIKALPAEAVPIFERQIYPACRDAAYLPDSVPEGTLRLVPEKDANGLTINRFVGKRWFGAVNNFVRPGRRAVIRTPDTHPGWFAR
jgi:hypothetical protein